MNARDSILDQIRVAVRAMPESKVDRLYSTESTLNRDEVIELFAERVADYKAIVIRCKAISATNEIVDALTGIAPSEVLLGRGLDRSWVVVGTEDTGFSTLQLDGFNAVVTTSVVSIAETGTIILDHRQDGQGRRALSLIPDRHICIVLASQIVHSVPEAIARLDPRRHQTWISGPSATSDIELNRVEGVHGPRDLRIILITDR
jgi:L-lactate dehydrogenase complex protein LldG